MAVTLLSTMRDAILSKWALFALITVVVLSIAAVYVNKHYIMPSVKPSYAENNEFIPKSSDQSAHFVIYYTTWCPYSKSAMEVWMGMKDDYNNKTINGTKLLMSEVDCDKEPNEADAKDVEEYPTIIITKDGVDHRLDGQPTKENIEAFIQSVLG
jgi:thiol-disulfide isomerase/thioredoxin